MTKALTQAAKRRKKRSRTITLPGGELAHQRANMGPQEAKEPADVVVLAARARQTGAAYDDCRNPMLGCVVGRRLMVEHVQDRDDLWRAVMHMRRVVVAYDRSLGVNRHPQCANILAPAEKLEASASSPAADLRTPEDKARQAQAAWMALHGWMNYADPAARVACERAVVDEPDQPIADWSGVVLALRCVVDGLAGKPVQLRARK
jgi:hypothetical protein